MKKRHSLKKNKRANIMFLVLFLMFISSLLGLLVSQYVQYMIRTASIFQNYYATYYLTYGGLELGLTQVKFHGYGFESEVTTSGSSCRSDSCQVVTTVVSRASVLAETYNQRGTCNELDVAGESDHTYTSLGSGDCFIIPLFVDNTAGFDSLVYTPVTDFLDTETYNPIIYNRYANGGTGESYSLRVIDEGLENLDSFLDPDTGNPTAYAFGADMSPYSGAVNYFIVANPTSTTKDFCLELANERRLPMRYVNVTSIGEDGANTIALNAIKNNELPSFLCYGAISP